MNFFQFLSRLSEFSSAMSFITSLFISERGVKQFLKPMLQAKLLVYVKAN